MCKYTIIDLMKPIFPSTYFLLRNKAIHVPRCSIYILTIFEVFGVSLRVGKQLPNSVAFLFDLNMEGSLKGVVYETRVYLRGLSRFPKQYLAWKLILPLIDLYFAGPRGT